MCGPAAIPIMMAASVAVQAKGQYDQGQAAKQVGRNNQIMGEYAARDAQQRGEEAAIATQRRTARLKGTQRAVMAARGLDLGVGTPAEILDQTDFFGEEDVRTVRSNAAREAWTARTRGADAAAQGRLAAQQGAWGAAGTILGGTAQVADRWKPVSSGGRG